MAPLDSRGEDMSPSSATPTCFVRDTIDPALLGAEAHALASRIFPLARSLTGEGVRQTLAILREIVPLEIREVPSGTPAHDWTIPQEWRLHAAHIRHADGRKIVDVRDHSLHVLGYSAPIRARMSLSELKPHLFTLPKQPGLIPYRTSYYSQNWGFCLPHDLLVSLDEGPYDVVIDTEMVDGSLTYGELLIPGTSDREVLLTTHICHPSMANDNCSGLAVLTLLARQLTRRTCHYSYRILMAPGTIGALAWLSRNADAVSRISHGLVVSGLGDGGGPTYKRSRRGNAPIDRAMTHLIGRGRPDGKMIDFSPYGYDERQFCSPGYDLPVGSLQRSPYGSYPEYHTSGDNLDFIKPESLGDSAALIASAIDILETDRVLLNASPMGEPQLGRRGLYAQIGGDADGPAKMMAMLWALNLGDGRHSLLDIAERAGLDYRAIAEAARRLESSGLLRPATPDDARIN